MNTPSEGGNRVDLDIKVVFLDIDGTMYYGGRLVPSAIEAVDRLLHKGIQVAVCTGRSVLHTREVQAQLGIKLGVYFNGSLAMQDERILYSAPLDPNTVQSIIDYCDDESIPIVMHAVDEVIAFHDIPEQYVPILEAFEFPPIRLIDTASWQPKERHIYQFNAFMDRSWDAPFKRGSQTACSIDGMNMLSICSVAAATSRSVRSRSSKRSVFVQNRPCTSGTAETISACFVRWDIRLPWATLSTT